MERLCVVGKWVLLDADWVNCLLELCVGRLAALSCCCWCWRLLQTPLWPLL